MCLTTAEQRQRITSPDLLTMIPLMQHKSLFVFLAIRAHCCLMFKMLSTRTPRSFSPKLLSSQLAPCTYLCMGLFVTKGRIFYIPSLKFMRFLFCQVLQPVQVSLNSSIPLWCINNFSQFHTICRLAESALYHTIQVVNEDVEQCWPICDLSLNRFCTADHNPLGLLLQPIFNPPHHPLI